MQRALPVPWPFPAPRTPDVFDVPAIRVEGSVHAVIVGEEVINLSVLGTLHVLRQPEKLMTSGSRGDRTFKGH